MFKRIRNSLKTTEGKLKAIILLSGFIIIMAAISYEAIELTSAPAFCKSCHEMYPEYYTWENSAHSKITCVACHVKPGAVNTVVHKVQALSMVYYHFKGFVSPISLPEKIDNAQCEQCHDMSKKVTTPSGDLKFDHTMHLNKDIDCVKCHAGVAHGQIEENGFTALGDYESWNSPVGKAYVNSTASKHYTKLQMGQCIECHEEKSAPVTCNTCHKKLVKPDSHTASTWLSSGHGQQASADFKNCDKCHSVTSKYKGDIPPKTTVVEYARTNTMCNTCHSQKPVGHSENWKIDHQNPAKANRTQCLVCHDDFGVRAGDNVPVDLTCQACHVQTHKSLNLDTHPYPIPSTGFGAECAKCHETSTCENCHGKAQK